MRRQDIDGLTRSTQFLPCLANCHVWEYNETPVYPGGVWPQLGQMLCTVTLAHEYLSGHARSNLKSISALIYQILHLHRISSSTAVSH